MESITWKCECCPETGTGLPPDCCPTCEQWIKITNAGYLMFINGTNLLHEQARSAAEAALGHSIPYDAEISFEGVNPTREGETFSVKWDHPACARGCCGTEYEHEEIPIRYLGLARDEIIAERTDILRKQVAEREAAEKAKSLKEAQDALERAAAVAATAQAKADKALADARAKLAALTGGAS